VIENSPAGLVMMMGEVIVTVTGEDRHQAALDPYRIGAGGQRHVAVELAWCTILAGQHSGERVIEVRLDGRRVGELTHLMSERYGPLVRQVAAGGGRPGCEAIVQRTAKGLEITLRLPRAADTAVPTFAMAPVASVPPEPPKRTGRRAGWIAAGVVGAIAFFGIIGSNMDDSSTTSSPSGFVAGETTTDAPTTDTTATSTVTTTPKPAAPKPKPKPKPPAPRTTTPKPAPAPPVQPKPASTCDPNYTGCVPVASDVDCAGGSGNGPEYAVGPVDVIGSDVYDLDRDGDGVACE
jgi:hypothetical protein